MKGSIWDLIDRLRSGCGDMLSYDSEEHRLLCKTAWEAAKQLERLTVENTALKVQADSQDPPSRILDTVEETMKGLEDCGASQEHVSEDKTTRRGIVLHNWQPEEVVKERIADPKIVDVDIEDL